MRTAVEAMTANDLLWWEIRIVALDGLCSSDSEKDHIFRAIIRAIYEHFGEAQKAEELLKCVGVEW